MLSDQAQLAIDAAQRQLVTPKNPLLNDLAAFDLTRPHQIKAIEQILDAFTRVPVVVLDAPTGSGKTLIGEVVRRMLQTRAAYVCSTKSLQDQVARSFPWAKVLKGRANYPTQLYPDNFHPEDYLGHISCGDCTYSKQHPVCNWCSNKRICPYEQAKAAGLRADLVLLNTSYFLTECNGVGRFSRQPLVIADEADLLENELRNYVTVEISKRRMDKLGWKPPKFITKEDSWAEWLEQQVPKLSSICESLRRTLDLTDIKAYREYKLHTELHDKLSALTTRLRNGGYIYTGKEGAVAFKPVTVDEIGTKYLWNHSARWLLMSATIISPEARLYELGYAGTFESITVPSIFAPERRRVIVKPVANLSKKIDERGKLVLGITDILTHHPGERVLLHTVSYDLAQTLGRLLLPTGREVILYTSSAGKDHALQTFLDTRDGILLSPSMARGVDLIGETCNVQIICKVPFPYLGDRQVATRLHTRGGQTWYTVQTVSTIVQMCGRTMRSEKDFSTTYLLDSQFGMSLWSRARGLFPEWWKDALVWERP